MVSRDVVQWGERGELEIGTVHTLNALSKRRMRSCPRGNKWVEIYLDNEQITIEVRAKGGTVYAQLTHHPWPLRPPTFHLPSERLRLLSPFSTDENYTYMFHSTSSRVRLKYRPHPLLLSSPLILTSTQPNNPMSRLNGHNGYLS